MTISSIKKQFVIDSLTLSCLESQFMFVFVHGFNKNSIIQILEQYDRSPKLIIK